MKHKSKRHLAILEIIEKNNIETQEALTKELLANGINTTQATISRDIKALHLVKVLQSNNKYRYEQGSNQKALDKNLSLNSFSIFKDSIIEMNIAQNLLILKCHPGMAAAICVALDSLKRKEIKGTIAGDDTIFIALETMEEAQTLKIEINNIIR